MASKGSQAEISRNAASDDALFIYLLLRHVAAQYTPPRTIEE